MKHSITKITFLIISCAFTCSSGEEVPTPDSTIYKACCGVEPVEFSKGKGRIYVPNSFTPDVKGNSRFFMPYINENVLDVQAFTIYSAEGDTVLFQRPSFNFKQLEEYAWNGTRPDGSAYTGLFKYKMSIYNDEKQLSIIEGSACAIRCGAEAKVFKTKEGCFFPSQAGNAGNLDKSKSKSETTCFE